MTLRELSVPLLVLEDEDLFQVCKPEELEGLQPYGAHLRVHLTMLAQSAARGRLLAAQLAMIQNRFDPDARVVDAEKGTTVRWAAHDLPWRDVVIEARTPAGVRRFGEMEITSFFGQPAVGPDRWAREGADGIYDNLLGIPLWGQRLPVWADWRHEQGQYGRAAATVDDELLEMAVHAKGTLAEVFPELPARPFRLATFHGDV